VVTQPDPSRPVAVVGTTTWGTTLALLLARRGVGVRLWARSAQEAARLRQDGEHTLRLPGQHFPSCLTVTSSLAEALQGAVAVVFAVPSNSLRQNARLTAPHFTDAPLVISACKGLERATSKRMSQVLAEELPQRLVGRICALSGPNLAREIVAGIPASTVMASSDPRSAQEAQRLFNSPTFRVYTNADMAGVELAGALKNIVAIGAGISDGLQAGNNAKAAFVTRGLAEITRLGVAAGASPLTFAGLAGLGDLIATCYSPLSRNRMVGEQIAKGLTLQQALASLGGEVAEGVTTTPAVVEMARGMGVEMPIAETTNRVLFEGLDPRQAALELMGRAPRAE
jgi:glycerol-3-phosphate dehydrogenase (NAD(P)+)